MNDAFEEIEITISMKCAKHFLPNFIAMLKEMEYNGKIGHSEWLAFYSDGDGAFHPKITIEAPQDILEASKNPRLLREEQLVWKCYDAG